HQLEVDLLIGVRDGAAGWRGDLRELVEVRRGVRVAPGGAGPLGGAYRRPSVGQERLAGVVARGLDVVPDLAVERHRLQLGVGRETNVEGDGQRARANVLVDLLDAFEGSAGAVGDHHVVAEG